MNISSAKVTAPIIFFLLRSALLIGLQEFSPGLYFLVILLDVLIMAYLVRITSSDSIFASIQFAIIYAWGAYIIEFFFMASQFFHDTAYFDPLYNLQIVQSHFHGSWTFEFDEYLFWKPINYLLGYSFFIILFHRRFKEKLISSFQSAETHQFSFNITHLMVLGILVVSILGLLLPAYFGVEILYCLILFAIVFAFMAGRLSRDNFSKYLFKFLPLIIFLSVLLSYLAPASILYGWTSTMMSNYNEIEKLHLYLWKSYYLGGLVTLTFFIIYKSTILSGLALMLTVLSLFFYGKLKVQTKSQIITQ